MDSNCVKQPGINLDSRYQHATRSTDPPTRNSTATLSIRNQSLYPVLPVQLENMSSQPSVVIVPGSFCPGSMYDPLVMPLRAKGYEIHVLEPPCYPSGYKADSSAPQPNMYNDAKFINEYVTALANSGKDVIVLAHSYGGEFRSFNVFSRTRKKKRLIPISYRLPSHREYEGRNEERARAARQGWWCSTPCVSHSRRTTSQ
jgi:hypothetical protein